MPAASVLYTPGSIRFLAASISSSIRRFLQGLSFSCPAWDSIFLEKTPYKSLEYYWVLLSLIPVRGFMGESSVTRSSISSILDRAAAPLDVVTYTLRFGEPSSRMATKSLSIKPESVRRSWAGGFFVGRCKSTNRASPAPRMCRTRVSCRLCSINLRPGVQA